MTYNELQKRIDRLVRSGYGGNDVHKDIERGIRLFEVGVGIRPYQYEPLKDKLKRAKTIEEILASRNALYTRKTV